FLFLPQQRQRDGFLFLARPAEDLGRKAVNRNAGVRGRIRERGAAARSRRAGDERSEYEHVPPRHPFTHHGRSPRQNSCRRRHPPHGPGGGRAGGVSGVGRGCGSASVPGSVISSGGGIGGVTSFAGSLIVGRFETSAWKPSSGPNFGGHWTGMTTSVRNPLAMAVAAPCLKPAYQ